MVMFPTQGAACLSDSIVALLLCATKQDLQSAHVPCFLQVEEDPNTGLLWLSRDGHIFCCSQGLHHVLGHTPSDVEGSSLQSLGERFWGCYAEQY